MIVQARCRGKCARVTPHHVCVGGDAIWFTCTKCGEQFSKPINEERKATP